MTATQKLLDQLEEVNATLSTPFALLNRRVLTDTRFATLPASLNWHHLEEGGLVLHTSEVVGVCRDMLNAQPKLDRDVLLTAAIWHDYGKIFDYERRPDGGFCYTTHHDTIRHLAASYGEFREAAKDRLDRKVREEIEHCILAHHGRREWGSPVEPATPEAWTLHLADMLSIKAIDRKNR